MKKLLMLIILITTSISFSQGIPPNPLSEEALYQSGYQEGCYYAERGAEATYNTAIAAESNTHRLRGLRAGYIACTPPEEGTQIGGFGIGSWKDYVINAITAPFWSYNED